MKQPFYISREGNTVIAVRVFACKFYIYAAVEFPPQLRIEPADQQSFFLKHVEVSASYP